jgi:hypothetical protein
MGTDDVQSVDEITRRRTRGRVAVQPLPAEGQRVTGALADERRRGNCLGSRRNSEFRPRSDVPWMDTRSIQPACSLQLPAEAAPLGEASSP